MMILQQGPNLDLGRLDSPLHHQRRSQISVWLCHNCSTHHCSTEVGTGGRWWALIDSTNTQNPKERA